MTKKPTCFQPTNLSRTWFTRCLHVCSVICMSHNMTKATSYWQVSSKNYSIRHKLNLSLKRWCYPQLTKRTNENKLRYLWVISIPHHGFQIVTNRNIVSIYCVVLHRIETYIHEVILYYFVSCQTIPFIIPLVNQYMTIPTYICLLHNFKINIFFQLCDI